MSRLGRKPILLDTGVKVNISDNVVNVEGQKGKATLKLDNPKVYVEVDDGKVYVKRRSDDKEAKMYHGLYRSLLNNMIIGVSKGFSVELDIVGLGYKGSVQSDSNTLVLTVGYSHPVYYKPPDGVSVSMKGTTRIVVEGIDKAKVGQVAADLVKIRFPDSYKGAGIRYAGEQLKLKPGKAAKKK